MRRLLLSSALLAMVAAPVAFAQTQNQAVPTNTAQQRASQSAPENCGTPDEPKPCPPMPKHPLLYYPGDRPTKS